MEDSILNFLNYEGLEYYDGKSEERTDKKIAVETERAKTVESTLTTNLNNEISRAKKAEKNNATSINNEVTRATNAENTLATNLSSHTSNKSNPHGVTKAQVGLGNVNNTSDANKPISTATQTALNAKAPLASPTLTGTPKAPTATAGTNTTQIATTAFVTTAVANGIAASDAMIIKGTIGTSGTVTSLPTTYKTGWTYRVVTAGTYAGQVCEIGDLIVALVDRSGSGNVDSDWCVAQTNINGAITGIKSGDAYITTSQSGSVVTITHKDVTRTNTTSTASPTHGGTFTAVKTVTSDAKGHVTGVDTETVTLPTYTSLKNPYALTIQGNGTTLTNGTYDGSAAKTVNITPSSIGAAASSHTHSIANVTNLQTTLDGKAVKKELISENLNDIKTPGFYNAGGGNSVTNKPSGVEHFGLYVVKIASGDYYTQILIDNNKKQYRRHCENGTWGSWAEDKLTDTNTTYSAATTSASGLMTAAMVTKLNGIATGAEVNQNAFSNVVVGSTTIAADSKTDTLTLTAGSNVTITPDATNDKITISSSHSAISKSTDTTSTASPSAGKSFTTIDSVTRDYNGHVTKINTKTVTLPTTPVTIDSALSSTSTNPLQNKAIYTELYKKTSNPAQYSSITPTNADISDVLKISTTDAYATINQPHKVYQMSTDTTAIANMPSLYPQGTGFVGMRYVHYFSSTNILVELMEFPGGRRWYNNYVTNKWNGWRCEPKNADGESMSNLRDDLDVVGCFVSKLLVDAGISDNTKVWATICMQKLSSTKCNIYISYKISSNVETDKTKYYFMSAEKIRTALGLKTLNAGASQSQVTFNPSFDVNPDTGDLTIVSVESEAGVMGYTGVKATIDATGIQMGRIYNDTGSYGSWDIATHSDSLFKTGTYGQINFYSASYSV